MFLLFSVVASAQNDVKPLTIGQIHTLHSSVLNEDRKLNIVLPQGFDAQKAYPVLYLLDGSENEDLLHVYGLYQFFQMTFGAPDMIIVGIANVDRKRDFTFPVKDESLKKDFPTTGGSAKFLDFIGSELQPYIGKTFKTTSDKYIIGQSLGGLLAIEAMLRKPALFTHYFIVSPSLWWDNEALMAEAPKLLASGGNAPKYVYLSVGEKEAPLMKRNARDFEKMLKARNIPVDFESMGDEDHASILHNSLYEGFLKHFVPKK